MLINNNKKKHDKNLNRLVYLEAVNAKIFFGTSTFWFWNININGNGVEHRAK